MKQAVNYGQYLASREWALLKKAVRLRSGGMCERCKNGPYEQTHHLTYERLGRERLEDLQALCRYCHEYLSAVSAFDPMQPDVDSINEEFAKSVLEPILKISDPESRKQATKHLAFTLNIPACLLLAKLELMTEGS